MEPIMKEILMRRVLALTFLLVILGLPAWATTFFVAPTGLDSNPGTSGSPFLTIQKCIDVMVAGDTCTVADGTYSVSGNYVGNVTTAANGTAGSPITLKSTNPLGAHVVLNGNAGGSYGFLIQKNYWIIDGFEISGGTSQVANIGVAINFSTGTLLKNSIIHDIATGVCSANTNGFPGVFVNSASASTVIDSNVIHTIGRLRTGENGCAAGQNSNDHGIYLESVTGVTVQRNLFYDVYRGWSIHAYKSPPSTTSNVNIYNNTFARHNPLPNPPAGQIIIQTSTVTNVNIKNNISYDANIGMLDCHNVTTATSITISSNLSDTDIKTLPCLAGFSFGTNKTFTSPGFVNATLNNFALAAGSAAIDAGVNVGLPFMGSAPDMGYAEFGGDVTPPAPPTGLKIQ